MGSKDIGTTMIKPLYKFNCVVEHMMSIVAAYIYRYLGYATYLCYDTHRRDSRTRSVPVAGEAR